MNKNHKTLDVDQLFVRNIIFKDFSNRPISSNQYLTTRGDGGTYFSDQSTTTARAFVEVRAEDIRIPATTTSNILQLGAGAGIQYYSTAIGGGINTKLYITATAPEQIAVIGNKTLNFSSLRDEPAGGRTLYYAATGDTTINVSDTTILFGSVYNSSYGSLQSTISTTQSILNQQSTLISVLTSTIEEAVDIISSANLSTLYDLTDTISELSTFVWSSFVRDGSGNHTILNVREIHSSEIYLSTLYASTAKIGHTLFSDSNYQSTNDSFCSAVVSTGSVSTIANYLVLSDDVTKVKFGFDKEHLFSYSTQNGSTFQTLAYMYQMGLIAQLSTQGGVPFNPKDQFKPVIEQIEAVEQIVTYSKIGSNVLSTVKNVNYAYRTIGKFDELCSAGDQLIMTGAVSISTLNVSSLNTSGVVGINSTVSTFYASTLFALRASFSSVNISTARITNMYTSSGIFSTFTFNKGYGNLLSTGSLRSGYIQGDSVVAGDLYSFTGAIDNLSTNNLSTCSLAFCQANGIGISTLYTSTGQLSAGFGQFSSLLACDLEFCHAVGSTISTLSTYTGALVAEDGDICELRFCHGIGSSISTFYTSTGTLTAGAITFNSATGSNLSTINASTTNLRFDQGTFVTATGSNLSTINASTTNLRFDQGTFVYAEGSNLSTINASTTNLRFNQGTFVYAEGSNLSTINASTTNLRFDQGTFVYAEGSNLSTINASTTNLRFNQGTFVYAEGSNLSTINASTTNLRFDQGTFVTATGSNLSTINASTTNLRFDQGTFVYATGSNLSTINASTTNLRFDQGTFVYAEGSNLSTINASTTNLRFDQGTFVYAEGSNLSTINASTTNLRFEQGTFVTATGSNLSTINASTTNLRFEQGTFVYAEGSNLSTINASTTNLRFEQGSFVTATGSNISSINTSTTNLRFEDGSASNLNISSISTGSIIFGIAQGTSISTTFISASQILNSSFVGFYVNISTVLTDHLSAGVGRIGELDVNCISANCISTGLLSWGDAYGSTMSVLDGVVSTIRISTVMGFTEPIFTFDMANRRVGVNLGPTQQPRATMDIRGIVYANNFVTTSDRRLKHSIKPLNLSDSYSCIPNAYQYVNEDGCGDIGVMADEVEQIAPECVYTRPDGYKAVSYTKLVPVCLTLIRSLSERVARLESGK
jgi:hypothetical protein